MKKTEGGGVSAACKLGEIAAIVVARDDIYSGLYARTLNNTPANEAAIRGF
jgi:hypothetical protein